LTENSLGKNSGEEVHPMELLLAEDLNLPVAGEVRTGRVVSHDNAQILVDIGTKSEGIITGREVDTMDAATRELLAVGNEVVVCIVDPEDQNGNLIVSYSQAAEEQDWKKVANYMEKQKVCKSRVIGYNRGGVLVKIGEIRGFVPNSQLRRDRYLSHQEDIEEYMQQLVGKDIHAKVIEVDRSRNRLILSERAAEQEIRESRREEILAELKEGDVCDGRVVNIADFGAFIDIGGIEGLVHLSELSWKHINNPNEVLNLGDEVKVSILSIDHDKQRLALSMKRLEDDPWKSLDEQYRIGQLVEATITKITKFGAFARLSDDNELIGLIHISELSEDHVAHPREVVKVSQKVMVRIIRIDQEQRQLGLSIKEVSSDKFLETDMELMTTS